MNPSIGLEMRAMAVLPQVSSGGRISSRGRRQGVELVVPRQHAATRVGHLLPCFPSHATGSPYLPSKHRNIEARALDPQSLMTMLGGAISLRDIGAFSFACIGSAMLVGSIKMLEYKGHVHKTLSRKLVHSFAGPLFLACWPFFGSTIVSQCIASIVPALNGLSLFLAGTRALPDDRAVSAISRTGDPTELLRGPLYYTIALTMVTALLWRESVNAVAIVSIMCGGDGFADIIGRAYGKHWPLPWNPSKSWPGSFAMFLGGFITSIALLAYLSTFGFMDMSVATVQHLALVAAAATVLESLPINTVIDDNISVPILVYAMGYFIL